MMTTNQQLTESQIIAALVREWRTEIQPNVKVNACILASRLTSEVLSYFGIYHEVFSTYSMAVNNLMYQHYTEGLKPFQWHPEAWSVGVGFENAVVTRIDRRTEPGYEGHVCVATETTFIDLSALQFDRPKHGIMTGGVLVVPNTDIEARTVWPTSDERWNHIKLDQGTLLFRLKADNSFKESIDWRRNYRDIAGPVIRAIKKTLSENSPTIG